MKSLTMNLMFATAALMVASSAAMAADAVSFEIPFTFQAGSKTMAAGTYQVRPANDKSFYTLTNARSGQTAFVSALAPHDPKKAWEGRAGGTLEFDCSDGPCGLAQIWAGPSHQAVYISNVKHGRESGRLALIRSVNSK
jgi:opacity protein-like surface antigen